MPKNSSSDGGGADAAWHKCVCRSPTTPLAPQFAGFTSVGPRAAKAPIDQYLEASEALVRAATPDFFNEKPEFSRFSLVGVVSCAEHYFRELFAGLLLLCPLSQQKSAQRDMKLGSAIWYRVGQMERGAFEHFSFASADAIIETLNRYFGIQLDPKNDPFGLLREYDRLCELRHAVVHSAGVLSGKNAMKLHLTRTSSEVTVDIDFTRFQQSAEICTALVCSMNIELFRRFAERWRDNWPTLIGVWDRDVANERFRRLWALFASTEDRAKGLPSVMHTSLQCRRQLLAP